MKRYGFAALLAPWTASEDRILSRAYATGGIAAAAAALPARSVASLFHRAQRLGVSRRRWWTRADVELLRSLWGVSEMELADIAARLGRTEKTVYWMAQKLGLPLGCPDGWEYLSHAARRTGYAVSQLRAILTASGVQLQRALARPADRRGHRQGARRRMWIVMPEVVDAAVASWLDTEPLHTAARRLGVCDETLAARLRAIGIRRPRRARVHWRIASADLERALATRPLAGASTGS